jgi:predicted SAM-dependent methyltransferase
MQNTKIEELKNNLLLALKDKSTTHGLARSCRHLLKEIVLYKNHLEGVENLTENKIILNTEKIQVGGGTHILEGYLNIDIVPPADIVYDVREGIPLKDKCSEYIFCEHFLEHIDYPISAKKFVNECNRILKTSGKLVIGVPDGQLIVDKYVSKDKFFFKEMIEKWYAKRNCLEHFNTYIDLLNYHFRDQDDDEKYTPHLWTYDYEKLVSMLKMAGFKKVARWKFDAKIANPKREWASLYVVATK